MKPLHLYSIVGILLMGLCLSAPGILKGSEETASTETALPEVIRIRVDTIIHPVAAEFVIDLKNMECADLIGGDLHDVLINHLQDDDFFDVENYPEAVFVITDVARISGAKPGSPDLEINGELTLKGQTHPINFQAASGVTEDGKPAAQAVFSIDRTRWGVLYGSGKFFHRLAGHLVNDLIEFEIKIVGAHENL